MSDCMNLSNFEEFLDDAVQARGWQYFVEGNVLSITKQGSHFIAKVEGSALYTVRVTLDEEGNIMATDCDCPYDFGDYCKHQAAVLYSLREQTGDFAHELAESDSTQNQLLAILQNSPKDELVDIIMSLANADPYLATKLVFTHGQGRNTDGPNTPIRLTKGLGTQKISADWLKHTF